MKGFLGFLAVVAVAAVVIGGCVVQGYNQAIELDTKVKSNWAEVDTQLQRRMDVINQVVGAVKGIAGQEQKIFLGIAEAQKAYFNASTTGEKVEAANQVESALSRLLVLNQQYPELKSNENFLKLQDTIEGTENRLSVARNHYNNSVQELDAYMRKFPTNIYASFAHIEQPKYFKAADDAKEAPKVDFSDKS
jgi:LemA protein